MKTHWTADAERVWEGDYLGECDNGDWWVRIDRGLGIPYEGERWARFSRWNPRHWLIYWRSRRAGCLVWLERAS